MIRHAAKCVLPVLMTLACSVASGTDYTLTVSGTIRRQFQDSGQYDALKQIQVKIYDSDAPFGSELLATTNTNDNGEYQVQVTEDEMPDIIG